VAMQQQYLPPSRCVVVGVLVSVQHKAGTVRAAHHQCEPHRHPGA